MKRIVCVHLLNDFSGSPLVLSNVAAALQRAGWQVEILTSSGMRGFLSNLPGVRYRFIRYRFVESKLPRLFWLLRSQLAMFLAMASYRGTDTVVYVNTLLPFGAALGARLWGLPVVYHLHETTVNPAVLKWWLKAVARLCASRCVYVSHFLQKTEPLDGVPAHVVHNCLPAAFIRRARAFVEKGSRQHNRFTVLMLCSLKAYKGVDTYVALAGRMPEFTFVLVLNADWDAISSYFDMQQLPENLVIFPSAPSVHEFYQDADVVVNLSHPDRWVETFGMTLLEGMAYGLPVIAPPVGGPTEIVHNGFNGFLIDARQPEELEGRLRQMATDSALYRKLSANALRTASRFDFEEFSRQVVTVAERTLPQRMAATTEALPKASAGT